MKNKTQLTDEHAISSNGVLPEVKTTSSHFVKIQKFRLLEIEDLMRIANLMIEENNIENLPKLLAKAHKYSKQALDSIIEE